METEILIPTTVQIETIQVKAGVRYWEDATVNGVEDEKGELIPFRDGDYWNPVIEIDTGRILNWPTGMQAEIHYKICDDGSYYLKDAEGAVLLSIEDNYVPSILCPEEDGYGDYIKMNVDEDGLIQNWKIDISGFFNEEDE